MVKRPLFDHFKPELYEIKAGQEPGLTEVIITGSRVGRPSRRLSLNQQKLRVVAAEINAVQKNKQIDYSVERINHLPTLQQVRLHTHQLQYPGKYRVTIKYRGPEPAEIRRKLTQSPDNNGLRCYLPSIDESEAGPAKIKFS